MTDTFITGETFRVQWSAKQRRDWFEGNLTIADDFANTLSWRHTLYRVFKDSLQNASVGRVNTEN